jgi:NADH-quinone oxidoreductase subunit M
MMLTMLLAIPLLGAAALLAIPGRAETVIKQVALIVSVVTAAFSIYLTLGLDWTSGALQLAERRPWIPSFGISWSLGLDGVAAVLIVMTTVLVPLVIVAGWWDAEASGRGSVKGFFALLLALEACIIGVFAATDVFLFYVFFEAMLIPIYFLIGRYGGDKRAFAALKFLLYSLVGGLLMLASLIGLYVQSAKILGKGTFDFVALTSLGLDPAMQRTLFLGFFIAFAIKAPMVPVHTWLPDAAAEGTPGTSTLLVGVLDKVGTFGMIRYLLPLFPEASHYYAPVIIGLAVLSIFYGALLAIGQTDMMRLIAYTSVSHFGFIVLGTFVMTSQGLSGAVFYMVNHAFSTGALFLVIGYLASRRGTARISDFGGVNKVAPLMAGYLLMAGLSSLALPGMSTFISEFLVLLGTFAVNKSVAVVATLGIVLAAVYILWMYQRTMTGEPSDEVRATVSEITPREIAAVAPMIAIIIALGIFPQAALSLISPTVATVQDYVSVTDPATGGEG